MKRYLPVIPVILFILLNACDDGSISSAEATAVAKTFTATMWTPTTSPSPLYSFQASEIIRLLNLTIEGAETSNPLNQLEHTIVADYQVNGVSFPLEDDGTATFWIEVHCECKASGQCCNPQQTFMEIMRAIDLNKPMIFDYVPPNVRYMKVECFDHTNEMAVMTVPWEDVKNFFANTMSGFELGGKVNSE